MNLEIPESAVNSLLEISKLSESDIQKFSKSLNEISSQKSLEDIPGHFSNVFFEGPFNPKQGTETILTLYQIKEFSGVPSDEFLSDIIDSLISNEYEIIFDHKEIDLLRNRLELLLDINVLRKYTKALRLSRDAERTFLTSKILSDVRPVFGKSPDEAPNSAIILHTIRITYRKGTRQKSLHLALDNRDLEELANVISRAQSKQKTLEKFLQVNKLENLSQ